MTLSASPQRGENIEQNANWIGVFFVLFGVLPYRKIVPFVYYGK
jgi:hypothetical protein